MSPLEPRWSGLGTRNTKCDRTGNKRNETKISKPICAHQWEDFKAHLCTPVGRSLLALRSPPTPAFCRGGSLKTTGLAPSSHLLENKDCLQRSAGTDQLELPHLRLPSRRGCSLKSSSRTDWKLQEEGSSVPLQHLRLWT